MPWQECCCMSLRLEFVRLASSDGCNPRTAQDAVKEAGANLTLADIAEPKFLPKPFGFFASSPAAAIGLLNVVRGQGTRRAFSSRANSPS